MKSFIDKVKTFDIGRLLTITLTIAPIVMCLVGILFPDSVLAVTNSGETGATTAPAADTLSLQISRVETIVTGKLLRMAVLVGTVWGAVQAYMSGKFLVLASTLGIGLGTYAILEWAKATWAFVI